MMYITRRNFHEAGLAYSYELEDGTKLRFACWNGEGFKVTENETDVLYVPVENPHPLDHYGEPDYYDIIGFDKKVM